MKLGTKENILIATITGATLLSGVLLTLPRASAETEAIDRVTITVPSSCSISSTVNNPINTATVHIQEYVDDIGETTIKATCNDLNGFSVYAIGFSDDTYGKTVLSASTVDHANDIVTGTATSGATSNWAMRLSPVAGTYAPTILNSFDDYSEVPSTYTKVATLTSRTDQSLGSSFTTNYAVYISGSQLADTYTGKVKYTMVHPASEPAPFLPHEETTASGKICYYPNTDEHEGTMGCQSASDNASVTLLASNFSRTGYGFAGWSDSFDYATNQNAKFYGPQETITVPTGTTANGLSLYAVWVKSAGSLQDTNKVAELCGTGTNALTTAPTDGTANLKSVSALTDQRDSQTYAIAKLADGKCWMIENLRLESTAEHNSDGTLAQGYGTSATYGNFGGLANAESANFTNSTTANSLYYSGTQSGDATINIDTTDFPAQRMPRYNNTNSSTRATYTPNQNVTSQDANIHSYGNYYTWHAAIADTTYYSSGNHDTTSICPTGWKLPLGKTSTGDIQQGANDAANKVGGFSYLDRKMGGTGAHQDSTDASLRWRKYPVNFLYSGLFSNSSAYSRGNYGYYWSSTVSEYYVSNCMYLYSSDISPGTSDSAQFSGYSIRCVSGS